MKDFHVVDDGRVLRRDDRLRLDDVVFAPDGVVRQPMDRAPVSRVRRRNLHFRVQDVECSNVARQLDVDVRLYRLEVV